jgi:hypothetical protein
MTDAGQFIGLVQVTNRNVRYDRDYGGARVCSHDNRHTVSESLDTCRDTGNRVSQLHGWKVWYGVASGNVIARWHRHAPVRRLRFRERRHWNA